MSLCTSHRFKSVLTKFSKETVRGHFADKNPMSTYFIFPVGTMRRINPLFSGTTRGDTGNEQDAEGRFRKQIFRSQNADTEIEAL